MLCDDYLCLVASNKQQIQRTKIQKNPQKHWITGNSQADVNSSNHEAVIAMKSAQNIQYLASDAV